MTRQVHTDAAALAPRIAPTGTLAELMQAITPPPMTRLAAGQARYATRQAPVDPLPLDPSPVDREQAMIAAL